MIDFTWSGRTRAGKPMIWLPATSADALRGSSATLCPDETRSASKTCFRASRLRLASDVLSALSAAGEHVRQNLAAAPPGFVPLRSPDCLAESLEPSSRHRVERPFLVPRLFSQRVS